MKKLLLGIVALSIFIASCSSSETRSKQEISKECRARQEITECMEVAIKSGSSFSIKDCIYAAHNDSCFIFNGIFTTPQGTNANTEYLYQISEDGKLIAVKNVDFGGSLLRNMNCKAGSGNQKVADAINKAIEKSEVNLSITIYNDLSEGSLIDITDALSSD